MANAKKWSGVAVALQSAIGAAVPITAITNATAGVVSAATGLPTAGQFVILNVQGMDNLNGRVFRAIAPTGTGFTLDSEDTTLYGTFVSGTFQIITFGTSITSATTIQSSGGDFSFIDTTTINATQKTQIPSLPNPATYTFDNIEDASDPGQIAMSQASLLQAQRAFKFTFAGGQSFVGNAYIGYSGIPGGQAQGLVTTQAVFTVNTRITKYAS